MNSGRRERQTQKSKNHQTQINDRIGRSHERIKATMGDNGEEAIMMESLLKLIPLQLMYIIFKIYMYHKKATKFSHN